MTPTPLRYPGGKQKLWPFIAELLKVNNLEDAHYVEPYAGGAGIAIELLTRGLVTHIHLNDACPELYAFWHAILHTPEDFIQKIEASQLNIEEWQHMKSIITPPQQHTQLDIGYAFFYLNRTNFSGIVKGGVIGGKNQTGKYKMDARFPKQRLITLILNLAKYKKQIHLYNQDAADFLQNTLPAIQGKTLTYCDPPYYNRGQQLYLNAYKHNEHAKIASIIQQLKTPWLVTYDNTPEIAELYRASVTHTFNINYSARVKRIGCELLIHPHSLSLPVIHPKSTDNNFQQREYISE